EVLGAEVAGVALEEVARDRFGLLGITERDQRLGEADERPHLCRGVAQVAGELDALAKRLQRAIVVACVVDEQPAEQAERRGDFVKLAEVAPRRDRLLELRAPG